MGQITNHKLQHLLQSINPYRVKGLCNKPLLTYFFMILPIIFFSIGCESTALYTSGGTAPRQNTNQHRSSNRTEYMVASWYGNPFHGRQTASGEIFNMYDYTAAHRTLPFGTRLRLINEENDAEAIVVINDRGPVPQERDLDVSYATAQALGFVNAGIMRLRVEYIE